jgi:hypothetical protein
VSGLLTVFAALSFVVALQLGSIKNDTSGVQSVQDNESSIEAGSIKNDTSGVQGNASPIETSTPIKNPSNYWFSLAGAIGSVATAAAFVIIIYQTRLTKKQIAQTQEEMDNTLRPWIGLLQTTEKDIVFYVDSLDSGATGITAKYFLKNYGRVPARIISKRYKWSRKEISKKDLYDVEVPAEWSSSRLQTLIFPDEDGQSSANSDEQSFRASPEETFYFGLLIEYDSGEGTRKREFGTIFRCIKDTAPYCLNAWT